ncbi:MAG: hypothetical protein ACTSQP_02085 [Promethearchaeota archaeon]
MSIKTLNEFIKSIPQFPEDQLNITDASLKLLKTVYSKAINFPKELLNGPLKLPLIVSYHPKASLLNNNIHETFLAVKVAEKLDMIPLWIPYIYDTGFKSAEHKIRRPTYVYFEGKHIPIRTSAAIRGNIMATEKPLSEKEIKSFFRELGKYLNATLTGLKTLLNKFNFGHFLFDLKKKMALFNKKSINKILNDLEKLWLDAIKNSKKLDESLTRISVAMFKVFGIDIGAVFMDDILVDLVQEIFEEILKTSSVKKDPSLLEDLFLAYNLESRERTPILYAGEGKFLAYDDNAVRVFDGNLSDLLAGLKNHKVLPTGNLIMVLFTAIGCKLVLGGPHTMEYYPNYFEKAHSLLKDTPFNSKMTLFSYGDVRFIDLRNMTDIMSAARVFDKVGSRNYIQKGKFTIPHDIIDHLNFIAGAENVPHEYNEILNKIISNQKFSKEPALKKEELRYNEFLELISKEPEELLKNPAGLKKWLKSTKFEGLHPVRLEVLLENLRLDIEMRLRMLRENVRFEQHILGGTIGSDESNIEVIYDGLNLRSKRYPTLLELLFYDMLPLDEFEEDGELKKHENEWIWLQFEINSDKNAYLKAQQYDNYEDAFNALIPKKLLPPILKF